MTIRFGMTLTELLSASLYLLTVILLIYAVGQRYLKAGRLCAVGSILTVIAANTFLIKSYQGEPAVAYERPGPIKRGAPGERGAFEFENDGTARGVPAGGNAGSGSIGFATMASAHGSAPSKAERQLLSNFDCADCPDMVVVRPGVFRIGAAPTDLSAGENERPTRLIGISLPFAIARNEVTLEQFRVFTTATGRSMPDCPEFSREEDPRFPVTCVSPVEATAYADWLAQRTRQPFRLPSEAEWEYAARSGETGVYSTGAVLNSADANIERARFALRPVGSYPANAFGINDMHGNAAEIVADCWVASPSQLPGNGTAAVSMAGCKHRTLRDAHAGEPASMTRLSARRPIARDARLIGVGFRVACDVK
ncbi:MAG: formylglycine-generating enzyme family protein [Hyphomicrobiaceae bacterium]